MNIGLVSDGFFYTCRLKEAGLEINFFAQVPAGD